LASLPDSEGHRLETEANPPAPEFSRRVEVLMVIAIVALQLAWIAALVAVATWIWGRLF